MILEYNDIELPIISIGIVVLNREWIIGIMLESLLKQNYPHNKIFVIIVDGGSIDKTVEICKTMLEKSDLMGYKIIVEEGINIPQGRNKCIENMCGEILMFWDSDEIIVDKNALIKLVNLMIIKRADILSTERYAIFAKNLDEVKIKIKKIEEEFKTSLKINSMDNLIETHAVGMGQTLINKRVFKHVKFDSDLTSMEDFDFCMKAKQKGFTILIYKNIISYDINVPKIWFSDIYVDIPLKSSLKALNKRARAAVFGYSINWNLKIYIKFIISNLRYLFYLSYVPMFFFFFIGIIKYNFYFIFIFSFHIGLFLIWQINRRGILKGIRSLIKSVLVGLPLSLIITFHIFKNMIKQK